ncbi:PE family protein, partial [Mycobacterium conspicuum]
MSFLIAAPEIVAAAATDVARIGSTITEANASAAVPTAGVLAAGADEVSAAIASLFSGHAQAYQALSARAAAFHQQFVQLLNGGAASYAQTEAANAEQALLNAVNEPTMALVGRPLIGNGANGAPGTGENGGDGGILFGNGGAGGSGGDAHPNGGNGGNGG